MASGGSVRCSGCSEISYVSKDENKYGSIEVGKQANFVLLSGDVFEVEKDKIKDIEILETYIDGESVYKK